MKLKRSETRKKAMNSYFGAEHQRGEAKRINKMSGGQFFSDVSSHFEIGGDFGNMFDKATHSTCLIVLRDASLPYAQKGTTSPSPRPWHNE